MDHARNERSRIKRCGGGAFKFTNCFSPDGDNIVAALSIIEIVELAVSFS